MRIKLTLAFFAIAVVLAFSTCKKQYVGHYDANYIGEWHSDTLIASNGVLKEIYFIINGDNSEYGFMCEINCSACECTLLTSGRAVINSKHNVLTIGSGNGKKRVRVKINTHPYQNSSGQWVCVIEDSNGNEITMYKR